MNADVPCVGTQRLWQTSEYQHHRYSPQVDFGLIRHRIAVCPFICRLRAQHSTLRSSQCADVVIGETGDQGCRSERDCPARSRCQGQRQGQEVMPMILATGSRLLGRTPIILRLSARGGVEVGDEKGEDGAEEGRGGSSRMLSSSVTTPPLCTRYSPRPRCWPVASSYLQGAKANQHRHTLI